MGYLSCDADPELFARVKEAVSIRQAAEYCGLEPNARGWCICPFHADRHPSMKLYPDGRGYYCFVCQSGGDQIRLAAKCLGINNYEAAKRLAEAYGVPVNEPQTYSEKRKAEKQARERAKLKGWVKWATAQLSMYRILLCEARQDPGSPHFTEGVRNLSQVEYLLECLKECPQEVYRSERTVADIGKVADRLTRWY